MSTLITFDGPKGVGKTTLIRLVEDRLRELSYVVESLSEKELMADAMGAAVAQAYLDLKARPGRASEELIAVLHRQGRLRIQETRLDRSMADVLLLDRWYPSDAVFRRHIDVASAIQANLDAGVRVPSLAFAVTCHADVSWERALQRNRSLDSKVIETFAEHAESTARFEYLAQQFGWYVLRTEHATSEALCSEVVALIERTTTLRYRG
jgi:thymidylate kinase